VDSPHNEDRLSGHVSGMPSKFPHAISSVDGVRLKRVMSERDATRVVITGIGVVSPYGVGRDRFWTHVSRGCSATRAITHFDASAFACTVAAPVPSTVTIEDGMAIESGNGDRGGHPDPRRYSRASLIAVLAAREAWADAGLRMNEPGAGVLVGSGAGGIDVAERQYFEFFNDGWKRVTPYAIPVSIVGMISSEISIALELHGISHVISTGCTSSTDAIGYATSLIRAGDADVILSGGADACVTPGMIFGFSRMRAVSTRYNDVPAEASRPFDRGRDGFVLGEGAWMVVLEREDRARARGATIYASIDGYGSTCDAYHRVQMDPDGEQIVRAMRLAIDRSGRSIDEIGYVNYHGTSTVLNDAVESRCVRTLFGRRADSVPGSSTKSMIGHPQGASGAAGVVTSALALAHEFLPPTINLQESDPDCDLDFLPNHGRRASPAAALCNCLGFGSKNSAIVLGAMNR
jgi:3-oxoacyl-[acyl-carrier-protein] synthase II